MIIKYEDIKSIKTKHKNDKIVLCTGCFDLFHTGHLRFFEESKKKSDILVVALLSDNKIIEKKGITRPIINAQDRLKLIDNLKIVDYVILINKIDDITNFRKYNIKDEELFFWENYSYLLTNLLPNVLSCSKFHTISSSMKRMFKEYNISVKKISLIDNISTTSIINKIIECNKKSV